MKGRQRFKCVKCGLVVEGREDREGLVRPYPRAGYDGSPVRPSMCMACADKEKTNKGVDE